MHRIVPSVTTFDQHFQALTEAPDVYRPRACPHCGSAMLWRHGCYHRKADRGASPRSNPVPICRYSCPSCSRTCSRLPLCIAPRRWYDWTIQQQVLRLLLSGDAVHRSSRCTGRDRHTVRRWRDWLNQRSQTFAFHLRSRFPALGRHPDQATFWCQVLDSLSLATAMAWLDREIIVP